MNYLICIFYIISALAPSIIWLLFYLHKDQHPEPRSAILNVFLLGVLVAAFVYIFNLALFSFLGSKFLLQNVWITAIKYFIFVALIEEAAKYLIARGFVMNSPHVDEPLDVMLYLVVCALGFAALENTLLVFTTVVPTSIMATLDFAFLRLIGATFLHTLASGIIGFFLALSFYYSKHKRVIFLTGLLIAIVMHGFYNFVVVLGLAGHQRALVQAFILIIFAIFTTWSFIKLKQIRSIEQVSI